MRCHTADAYLPTSFIVIENVTVHFVLLSLIVFNIYNADIVVSKITHF